MGNDFGESYEKVHFELNLMLKDLRLAKQVREKTKIDDPISEQTLKIFEDAAKEGFGKKDFASIVDYIQNSNKYNPTKIKITGNSLSNADLISGDSTR